MRETWHAMTKYFELTFQEPCNDAINIEFICFSHNNFDINRTTPDNIYRICSEDVVSVVQRPLL